MAERFFDIHLEVDPAALDRQRDPTRTVAELSRRAADGHCAEHRLVLRHPDPREVVVKTAVDAVSGLPVMLVASRWVADG